MLQGEHSAILSTFIKIPFVIKFFVLSIFEWLFYTGFTVIQKFRAKVKFVAGTQASMHRDQNNKPHSLGMGVKIGFIIPSQKLHELN